MKSLRNSEVITSIRACPLLLCVMKQIMADHWFVYVWLAPLGLITRCQIINAF